MEEYRINITKTGSKTLDGEYRVIFARNVTSTDQLVTFCALRKSPSDPIYAGASVKHPNDVPNDYRGYHDAYKRAVQALMYDFSATPSNDILDVLVDEKRAKSRFMGALWIAMGRPGYKKEPLTLDLSGKTKYIVEIPVK